MILSFNVLCERIPLKTDKTKYYRRKRIKQAIDELININFLSSCNIKNDNYEFIFTHKSKKVNEIEKSIKEKYMSFPEIKKGFLEYQFTEEEIDRLFDITRIPYIQALLRYCDVNKNKIGDTKGYVIAGLTTKTYDIDDMYYN